MKFFEVSFETLMWRYYLLMAVVITPFFIGIPILALLALPIFLISMMGVTWKSKESRKMIQMKNNSANNPITFERAA